MTTKFMSLGLSILLCAAAFRLMAQEPEWNSARVKSCDRACLIGFMDGYMNALFKQDTKALPPLQRDVRMTENAAEIEPGEGVLWRSKSEPTSFKFYAADPVAG